METGRALDYPPANGATSLWPSARDPPHDPPATRAATHPSPTRNPPATNPRPTRDPPATHPRPTHDPTQRPPTLIRSSALARLRLGPKQALSAPGPPQPPPVCPR